MAPLQPWVTLSPSPHSTEHPPTYYEFVGVRGCQDVLHLYRLLWASAALNILGLFLGVVTAAVLGAFKDMVSSARRALGRLSDGDVGSWRRQPC